MRSGQVPGLKCMRIKARGADDAEFYHGGILAYRIDAPNLRYADYMLGSSNRLFRESHGQRFRAGSGVRFSVLDYA